MCVGVVHVWYEAVGIPAQSKGGVHEVGMWRTFGIACIVIVFGGQILFIFSAFCRIHTVVRFPPVASGVLRTLRAPGVQTIPPQNGAWTCRC